tara:strand:+ start:3882 stop:7790 length:3909 start_codon:yes stop_codon:yes gene_type:complete
MAGYVRQSTASIINGSPITAPPINAEFNQLLAAFNASTGHGHTGATGDSPKINLATSVSGYLPQANGGMGGANKMDATTTPAVTNDNTEGYAPGSLWENTTTGRIYICVGSATGAAVWRELVQVESGNAILPVATDTIDLGSNTQRFQDLFLSGGIAATGNVTVGGTLTVTSGTTLSSTLGVTGDVTVANLSASGTTVITSIDLNSGAIDSTTIGTTTPAAGTFTTLNANTSLVAATADINGGTVDNATIGASTPSTGSFTDLGASGTTTLATVDINGGAIDGTNIGANASATGAFTTISTSGQATLATVDINGGAIDGATIGSSSTSSGAFTTLSASGGYTGTVTGTVTGNVTGNLTGDVTGDVTGNITGNVTSSGSSSFNNVTIDGTLNMNAGTTATIQNLTSPTNDTDAATKGYVDTQVANLVDSAPGNLNTLNELAAALNDDNAFSTTVTNSIATKLPLAGGTMSGAIAMGTSKITGLGDPTAAQDASTKTYTDTQRDTRVAKSGDTMSGNLAMGTNKITGLGTPTSGTDATTKTYVDGILGSATAAATSATNAATSETNAATSASNASTSATSASSSATSAAASYDSFDDRYLGAKSSAPTVDNDGDALVIGALYFDTTAGAMKVYSASGWTNAGSSVNGTSDRQTYTVSSAGQTVFSATYDSGYVDVYMNGVKLLNGTDFTATNGTSITLASGAAVNDIIDIVAYGTFTLADHLTETQSDAKYVQQTHTGNVDVTGTVTADGLTVDGVTSSFDTTPSTSGLQLHFETDTGLGSIGSYVSGGAGLGFYTHTGTDSLKQRIKISGGGNISFYEDTGTTPKFFWDASAESLDLGDVTTAVLATLRLKTAGSNNAVALNIEENSGNEGWGLGVNANGDLKFYNSGTGTSTGNSAVTFSDDNKVGIGTSPTYALDVESDNSGGLVAEFVNTATSIPQGVLINFPNNTPNVTNRFFLKMEDSTSVKAEINTTGGGYFMGNVGIGDNNPPSRLTVLGDNSAAPASNGAGINGIQVTRTTSSSENLYIYTGDASLTGWAGTAYPGRIEGFGVNSLEIGTRNEKPVVFATNNTARMTIDSNGTVSFNSVGNISASGGDLLIYSTEASHTGLRFGEGYVFPVDNSGGTTNGTVDLGIPGASSFKDLYLDNRVKLGASGGIEFGHATASSPASASSTLLDHYEEGTFEPTFTLSSGTVTMNSVYNTMSYTRVGRLVTVFGLVITASVSSPGGNYLFIDNLPYTSCNLTEGSGRSGGGVFYWDGSNPHVQPWEISEATTRLTVYMGNGGASNLTGGDDFYFSCTYQVP